MTDVNEDQVIPQDDNSETNEESEDQYLDGLDDSEFGVDDVDDDTGADDDDDDSDADDDQDDADDDAADDSDDSDDADDDAPLATEHEQWDDAKRAVIEQMGISEERVAKMDPALVLEMGLEKIESEGDADGSETDDAADGATDGYDAEKFAESLVENLNATNVYTAQESKALSEALSKTLETTLGGLKIKGANQDVVQIKQAQARIQQQLDQREAEEVEARLSEIYPAIATDEGREAVTRQVKSFVKQGRKFSTISDMIEQAADKAFGKKARAEIKEHKERVNKAKGGAPKRRSAAPKGADQTPEDEYLDKVLD